jgi:virginiamycin B lyase
VGKNRIGKAQTLTGQVTSAQQGPMEGVLVSAKREGSTITTTVVTDDKGRYRFPEGRIAPGRYALSIRAVGFDFAGPNRVEITTGSDTLDITLAPTKDLAAQLTNSEWLMSFPISDDFKKTMYGCTNCHTYERIAKSTYTTEDFVNTVLPRMASYSSQAFPPLRQVRKVPRNMVTLLGPLAPRIAGSLAEINLSTHESWPYALKTLPRPTGRATRVVITEYDLPRKQIQPHDVVLDKRGTVWFSDFGENMLGEMDAKTGAVIEHHYDVSRPGYSHGNLDLEIDADGALWLAMMNQTGFARFDPVTGKFELHPLPQQMLNDSTQQAMVAPAHRKVDGKVWFNDTETIQIGRVDLNTGTYDSWWQPFRAAPRGPHVVYGIYTDSQNNLFFADFGGEAIGRIDAKTAEVALFMTPTNRSRPRRGRMDAQDRLWFAEFGAGKVAVFDTRTATFKEWDVPTPYSAPYDAVTDRFGGVWASGMNDDRVTRIDTLTGDTVQYLMPRPTNVRRVFVDDSDPHPVFWTGSNHNASIVKVEPLD